MEKQDKAIDFDRDIQWYRRKGINAIFLFTPFAIIGFLCLNSFAEHFPGRIEILGVLFDFTTTISRRFNVDIVYKAVLALALIKIANRFIAIHALRYVRREKTKKSVVDFAIYLDEMILLLIVRYTGGIESPAVFLFLPHIVTISSIMKKSSVTKHVVFISVALLILSLLESGQVISHVDVYTPPLLLYNDTVYRSILWSSFTIFLYLIGSNAANALRKAAEREKFRSTFYRYLSPKVASDVLQRESITLGGESRIVTILFADIRDFTKYAEKASPEKVVKHLNEFFSEMVSIVFRNEGTLDKYVGDAVMATFGVPKTHPSDAIRACTAALEMRESLVKLNRKWESEYHHQFSIGIGIDTGEVIAGNIGSEQRMEYTVIGDSVNVASRLEQLTKDYPVDIIISESTRQQVKDEIESKLLDKLVLQGKTESIQVHELVGLK